ncbi:DNA cytosine methyltransferase [Methanospirillum sp.]
MIEPTDCSGFSAVDLFCGIGGLTHGLIRAGIPVRAGIDLDSSCKYSYESNNKIPFFEKDVSTLSSGFVLDLFDDTSKKILVGCAPCQPFSTHTQKIKKREQNNKWPLLYSFSRIVRSCEPEIISMENVPSIVRYAPFIDFLSNLKKKNYFTSYSIINCADYGVPQNRKRLVLLASKFDTIDLIAPTHSKSQYSTVYEAIGSLEKIGSGEISVSDPLHKAQKLSDVNLLRIKKSKPGGSWHDWEEDLRCKCHLKKTGATYSSVYGRMEWDKPAPTITTQFYNYGSGRFGHPEQNRALSLREGAILQSFPSDYHFFDPEQNYKTPIDVVGRHIGNAVPVILGEVIGLSIINHIRSQNVN